MFNQDNFARMKTNFFFSLVLFILCLFPHILQAQGFYVGGLIFKAPTQGVAPVAPAQRKADNDQQGALDRSFPIVQRHDATYKRQIDAFIKGDGVILGQVDKKEQKRIENYFFALLHQDPIPLSPTVSPKLPGVSEISEKAAIELDFSVAVNEFPIKTLYEQDVSMMLGPKEGIEENRPIQPFKMEGITLYGNHFDVKRYRGKIVLVDFFAPWCRPCVEDFARTKKLYEFYHKKGFEVISIGADSPIAIRELVNQQKLPWTVLSDEMTVQQQMPSIMNQHGIMSLPTAYLIDPQGRLIDSNARGTRLEKILELVFSDNKTGPNSFYIED